LINSQRYGGREREFSFRGQAMLWMSKFAGLESGKEILCLLKGHVWWVLSSPLLCGKYFLLQANTFSKFFFIIIVVNL
jgi:hypothetical protein